MRAQKLLWLLLALSLVFGGARVTLLFHGHRKSNDTGGVPTSHVDANAGVLTNVQPGTVANSGPIFSSDNVTSEEYVKYVRKLRSVGCPETRIRQVVLSDIDEYFARKRLQSAMAFDMEWWHEEPLQVPQQFLHEKAEALKDERNALVEKLLGPSGLTIENSPVMSAGIELTGPVLGSLPLEAQEKVQAIRANAVERMEEATWACAREKLPINAVQVARLREQARSELKQILTPMQLEEFLLRFSQNAQELREELRVFGPSADEFRKIFRAVDPLQHHLALEYGDIDALSKRQQDRFFEEREAAIRSALSPARYEAYLKIKNRRPSLGLMSASQVH